VSWTLSFLLLPALSRAKKKRDDFNLAFNGNQLQWWRLPPEMDLGHNGFQLETVCMYDDFQLKTMCIYSDFALSKTLTHPLPTCRDNCDVRGCGRLPWPIDRWKCSHRSHHGGRYILDLQSTSRGHSTTNVHKRKLN